MCGMKTEISKKNVKRVKYNMYSKLREIIYSIYFTIAYLLDSNILKTCIPSLMQQSTYSGCILTLHIIL